MSNNLRFDGTDMDVLQSLVQLGLGPLSETELDHIRSETGYELSHQQGAKRIVSLSLDSRVPESRCLDLEMTRLNRLNLLSTLSLSRCRLTDLGSLNSMGETSLKILLLPHNDLTSFPPGLSSLAQLEVLDVSFNKGITEVPAEVGLLTRLREFRASNCSITHVHSGLGESECLDLVDLSHNSITHLPPSLRAWWARVRHREGLNTSVLLLEGNTACRTELVGQGLMLRGVTVSPVATPLPLSASEAEERQRHEKALGLPEGEVVGAGLGGLREQ
ncbi:hypothetical protein KIPB_005078 [Kipferlia bialata]|uniref:Uncharacterized protein n=1 Tax=Kipferlia bialata TaxID=797122 RepID=A0A9K3GGQ5_9EUKA|nr:hypothetical protein KIPB_003027 [Kipferlia bialata]GIQ83719.1 hypothetical protein KIPB_005078 [Kipferlia bialata]|eukprot:g3027.t1